MHPDWQAATWPRAADPAAATRLIERVSAAWQEGAHAAPADAGLDPRLAAMLAASGGNSPYLAERIAATPQGLLNLAASGPEGEITAALAALRAIPAQAPRDEVARALRLAKQRVALAVALADIGGVMKLARVTGALSDLAEATLDLAVRHLLERERARGVLRHTGGFVVLAMGKLGARELNYSSDIDLFLLHDPDAHPACDAPGPIFARLARDLASLMSERDADGYVFRVDLRLRPDPASTPLCLSLPAALAYYESQGATWERAAMIKARPIAGDRAMGARFLAEIAPFIWRRHLDFAAIADIRAMKARIDAHKGSALGAGADPSAELLGHDVKLGQGGIREIEFVAQTLQLVWGGRTPALRTPATLPALNALAAAGHLPRESVTSLTRAYERLRQIEHRVQMIDDRQTHALPSTPAGLAHLAVFLGEADAQSFAAGLQDELRATHALFETMFARLPGGTTVERRALPRPGEPGGNGAGSDVRVPAAFTRPDAVRAALEAWAAGRPRALRTARARELAEPMLPALLAALARQPEPDAAFTRFDEMLWRLPAGVQILSMFAHNPDLLGRLADVLGAAPFLADYLAATPSALEGFLVSAASRPGAELAAAMRGAASVDEALQIAAPLIRGEEFRLALGEFDGRLSADVAGTLRADLAERAIAAILPHVLRDHRRRFGRIDGALAVVALGRLGSREMMAGSDLDLMLVYTHAPEAESDGRKKLAASEYFGRAAQALVAALTVPTRDGPLYAVDMRLRPSGNKGPVAVSLPAFAAYHQGSARVWELLALTRARVVAGPPALRAQVRAAIAAALDHAPDPAILRAETAAMRALIAREHRNETAWDIKHRPGGLMEVEFIAQALQLCARGTARTRHPAARRALPALARAGWLSAEEAHRLLAADRLFRGVLGLLRIGLGGKPPAVLPAPLAARLAALLQITDPAHDLDAAARDVTTIFAARIGVGTT